MYSVEVLEDFWAGENFLDTRKRVIATELSLDDAKALFDKTGSYYIAVTYLKKGDKILLVKGDPDRL